MSNRKLWTNVSLAAVVIIAVTIFLFSAQSAEDSSELSRGLTARLLGLFVPGFGQMTEEAQKPYLETWGHVLRKAAHFTEYAALGGALMAFLTLRLSRLPWKRAALIAWLGATLYAATDELHQMFVVERGPGFADVCLDSAGALVGALLAAACIAWLRRRKRSRASG